MEDEVAINELQTQLKAYDDLMSLSRPQGPLLVETARVSLAVSYNVTQAHSGPMSANIFSPHMHLMMTTCVCSWSYWLHRTPFPNKCKFIPHAR